MRDKSAEISTRESEALDREIAREKTSALGLAGRKLQEALERYTEVSASGSVGQIEKAVDDVAQRVWALLVQREAVGLRAGNVRWILRDFAVPDAALAKLGLRERPGTPSEGLPRPK